MKGWVKSMVVTGAVAGLLASAARPAIGAEEYTNDFGMAAAAVFTNIFYMPVKFVYATLGGITGGFAYCLTGGRTDTANAIWRPSLGGTYVITPSMLRGQDPIYFSGVTRNDREDEREERRETGTPREGY